MNSISLIIGGILIAYGSYGIIKRKIFAPWMFKARDRFITDSARNKSFLEERKSQDYFAYGSYAIIQGIILILTGIVIIIINNF